MKRAAWPNNPWIDQFIEQLVEVMQSRRTFVVAAGDLAHVGPAFGGERVTPGDLLQLHTDDHSLFEVDRTRKRGRVLSKNPRNCG